MDGTPPAPGAKEEVTTESSAAFMTTFDHLSLELVAKGVWYLLDDCIRASLL